MDAVEGVVRAGGALGARRRLWELRLLWIDKASTAPSMLDEERVWWCEGGFLTSFRRWELALAMVWLSMMRRPKG